MSKKYEMVYVIVPDLSEEETNSVKERVSEQVKAAGNISLEDPWGRRKLAYEINKYKEGIYSLVRFEAEPDKISALERNMSIMEGVLRYLIVLQNEKDTGLSFHRNEVKQSTFADSESDKDLESDQETADMNFSSEISEENAETAKTEETDEASEDEKTDEDQSDDASEESSDISESAAEPEA